VNKSDLISLLIQRYPNLPSGVVERVVNGLIQHMAETLSAGGGIEIRG
jgi:nucleoid DNA-binding protein